MTADYTPREGSAGDRALQHLQLHGPTSHVDLADAIDVDSKNLANNIILCLKHGLIVKESSGKGVQYRVGDGTPWEPDAEPPPAAEPLLPKFGDKSVHLAPLATQPFACALFSDGRFVVERRGQTTVYDRDETRQLVAYLDRLAPEAA
jgi:hypothetical protein